MKTDPDNIQLQRARSLRTNQTDAESRLWYHLRAGRFLGLKFKRQKPLGSYIVDFVCLDQKLVIELDGGQHNERHHYDQARGQWLAAEGFTVLRFWNDEVLGQTSAVLERIRLAIEERHPAVPSPACGRGRSGGPGEGSVSLSTNHPPKT